MLHFIKSIKGKNLKINLEFFKFNSKSQNENALIEIYNKGIKSGLKINRINKKIFTLENLKSFQSFKSEFLNQNKELKQMFS